MSVNRRYERAPRTAAEVPYGPTVVVRAGRSNRYRVLGDALWVYALAQVLALWFMLISKTMHPPAGANPSIMIFSHAGFAGVMAARVHRGKAER